MQAGTQGRQRGARCKGAGLEGGVSLGRRDSPSFFFVSLSCLTATGKSGRVRKDRESGTGGAVIKWCSNLFLVLWVQFFEARQDQEGGYLLSCLKESVISLVETAQSWRDWHRLLPGDREKTTGRGWEPLGSLNDALRT